MPESKDQSKKLPDTFEDAMAELESIVRELEASRMPLSDLVDNYERGTRLLGYCRGEIEVARQRVEKLSVAESGAVEESGKEASGKASAPAAETLSKSRENKVSGSSSGNDDEEDGRLL